MRRFGAIVVGGHTARAARWKARMAGSDIAPLSGRCQKPIPLEWAGHDGKALQRLREWQTDKVDYADGFGLLGEFGQPIFRNVTVEVPCRKCDECLKFRANMWKQRAAIEMAASSRTWFSTFTLSPESHWRLVARADALAASRGYKLLDADAREQYIALIKPLRADFQLYLKRIRKTAVGLRYMLVVERHKSGIPHLHALIHETDAPVRHRTLTEAWEHGFTTHKLVEVGAGRNVAAYVSKYISKSMDGRIMASLRYGKTV